MFYTFISTASQTMKLTELGNYIRILIHTGNPLVIGMSMLKTTMRAIMRLDARIGLVGSHKMLPATTTRYTFSLF